MNNSPLAPTASVDEYPSLNSAVLTKSTIKTVLGMMAKESDSTRDPVTLVPPLPLGDSGLGEGMEEEGETPLSPPDDEAGEERRAG